jgi:hypothetical protein
LSKKAGLICRPFKNIKIAKKLYFLNCNDWKEVFSNELQPREVALPILNYVNIMTRVKIYYQSNEKVLGLIWWNKSARGKKHILSLERKGEARREERRALCSLAYAT